MNSPRGPVVVVACDPRIADALHGDFDVLVQDGPKGLVGVDARVWLVGARLGSDAVRGLVGHAASMGVAVVVLASHANDPVQEGVYFSLAHDVASSDLRSLIAAAIAHAEGRPAVADVPAPLQPASTAEDAHDLHRVLTAARAIAAQSDLGHVSAHVAAAIRDLAGADTAHCWFFDHDGGELWRHGEAAEQSELPANRGLVAFVARTAQSIAIVDTAADPRFCRSIDDSAGRGAERFVAEPVVGPDRQVHAVLVGVRRRSSPPFDAAERGRLAALARCSGPAFHQLGLQLEHAPDVGEVSLYRPEAVEHHARRHASGDVIRIVPGWVQAAYVAVVAFVLTAVVYAFVGRVDHYSTGPAVVRIVGRTELTAASPGTIAEVMVQAGDTVQAGTVVARLWDPEPTGARLQREFDGALRDHLRDEDDAAAGQALRGVRSQLEQAEDRREALLVRAPHDAVVGDVRVRVGQAVVPGDIVASLVARDDALQVVAVLPGSDRPMLARGMPLRLELRGFPHAYDDLVVDAVGEEIVGPAELRRALGPMAEGLGDLGAGLLGGVVVHARLPSTTFTADRGTFDYYDGMLATAHVRLRRQRVLDVIVPGFDDGSIAAGGRAP